MTFHSLDNSLKFWNFSVFFLDFLMKRIIFLSFLISIGLIGLNRLFQLNEWGFHILHVQDGFFHFFVFHHELLIQLIGINLKFFKLEFISSQMSQFGLDRGSELSLLFVLWVFVGDLLVEFGNFVFQFWNLWLEGDDFSLLLVVNFVFLNFETFLQMFSCFSAVLSLVVDGLCRFD